MNRLIDISNLKDEYRSNTPFPHIVIDNFLSSDLAEKALALYPKESDINWFKYNNVFEKKIASNDLSILPEFYHDLLVAYFSSPYFVNFLEDLTGIKGLVCDPNFRGGGLHQILPGGKLDVHADFNVHPDLGLYRRINVILYLNKDWKDEYGGHLELWNTAMTECVHKILPIFNRAVIFNISDDAFHGHPDELKCPDGMSRKSIAVYYYSKQKPENCGDAHSTIYKKRPQDETNEEIEELRKKRAISRL